MLTLLNVRGVIPTFVAISTGKLSDINVLDVVPLEAESIVTMDRAYLDFARLYAIHRRFAFFVIRAKKNLRFEVISCYYSGGGNRQSHYDYRSCASFIRPNVTSGAACHDLA